MADQKSPGSPQRDPVSVEIDHREQWLVLGIADYFRGSVKSDKLQRFVTSESFLAGLHDFADMPDCRFMAFEDAGGGVIQLHLTPPGELKGRCFYYLKIRPGSLGSETYRSQVLAGDLNKDVLRHLTDVSKQIYMPLLCNPRNQQNWSEIVAKDVMERLHTFMANLQITVGQVDGYTRLPLPPAEDLDTTFRYTTNKERVHVLEGCLVTWTRQIKVVLKQDPEQLLKRGEHPGPLSEIQFWRQQSTDLNAIFRQLQSEQVRAVLQHLDQAKSTYNMPFAKLCKEVFGARAEANDNLRYLRPLESWFEQLDQSSLEKLPELFCPITHMLLLVWNNSRFYNTPNRLVVMVREICNELIKHAITYINGEAIFGFIEDEEAHRARDMIKNVLQVCGKFKHTYFDYKAKANLECPTNPWRIQNNALFVRLDSFLERCHDILDLTETVVQFSKLGKLEVGGTKGKTLSTSVQQIYADFEGAINSFRSVGYDIMDLEVKRFDDDFYEFRVTSKELERRLASVLNQGFEDATTIGGKFKLLDSFEGLLERPIIADELEKKQMSLIAAYSKDLNSMQKLFLESRDSPPIPSNMPPTAGALKWSRGLMERIRQPMEKLRQLNRTILERSDAKEVVKTYTSLVASIGEYEYMKVDVWGQEIEASSQTKLKLPLLRHSETNPNLLMVNFDSKLVELLREVKYFLLLGLTVPGPALTIYKKAEIFRRQTGNLELIVNMYNSTHTNLLPVERPLLKSQLIKIESSLTQGLKQINWKSHGIDAYLTEIMTGARGLDEQVVHMKKTLDRIHQVLIEWRDEPLFQRRHKPLIEEEVGKAFHESLKIRLTVLRTGGKEIETLLKSLAKKLRVSQGLPDWKAYLDFINNICVNGLAEVVKMTLLYLNEQIDAAHIQQEDKLPMIEINCEHMGGNSGDADVAYIPGVKTPRGDNPTVKGILNGWIEAFLNSSKQMKRIDTSDGSFNKELRSDPELMMYIGMINENLLATEDACEKHRMQFVEYSYLWTTDLHTFFREFLADSWNDVFDEDGEPVEGKKVLDLTKFHDQVERFRSVHAEIEQMQTSADIDFVRINSQPIKQALSTWVTKWIYLFTSYLQETAATQMRDLCNFMKTVNQGLNQKPEGDNATSTLMNIMKHIRDVRKTMQDTQESFGPLRDIMDLLKTHGIDMGAVVIEEETGTDALTFLEKMPVLWDNTVNLAFKKKEEIQPMQNSRADSIKSEIQKFAQKVVKFRQTFSKTAPFSFAGPCQKAYKAMDEQQATLASIEKEAAEYHELEELFELTEAPHVEITTSRKEIALLKRTWDMVSLYEELKSKWSSTMWFDIDTDSLTGELNRLQTQVKKMPKEIKKWDVYAIRLEGEIKNMSVVVPLVAQLSSNAMQDRHWKTILALGPRPVEKTPSFTFADVLSLQLHLHADEVIEIVEVATKERKVEVRLSGIDNSWSSLVLQFTTFPDTDVSVLVPPEEIIETLEEHQLQLQTMIGMGRFVDYFRDEVMSWQKKLSMVETTIKLWVDVQKNWMSLEAIFLNSADIRSQLPDETRQFEGINGEFTTLMSEATSAPNVVLACTNEARTQILMELTTGLERCQKALNEYLDTKKNIFPRFYFVSDTALLDILSNGNNAPRIMRHLGDCFLAVKTLGFLPPEVGKPSADGEPAPIPIPNTAIEMHSKDGEKVKFISPFKISGAVENWLGSLLEMMKSTLRGILDSSLDSAANWEVDRPRDRWLRDYPGQIALLASQIYWTEETENALEELEGGDEDSMRRYLDVCNQRLEALILMVQGTLNAEDRTKAVVMITIDVHARDVVQTLIDTKSQSPTEFCWQSQLRYYWQEETQECKISICDFRSMYSYEYCGNRPRLVITPLTDRCYITLTMALRLMLGGAPAGPAGTGKTETTKDLATQLGLPCYVFNCSEQMNYQSLGNTFKGLSQTGAWGCFDEFNRIEIEVLSVVATQVKSVLDAIRYLAVPSHRPQEYRAAPPGTPPVVVGLFDFMGEDIKLLPTVGFFITMNPGYAGRTELPENLKANFRSCAMIRPDLAPICENMLMAEGFITARGLAVKFVKLYELSSELLSVQAHYDWGLRAVKSVLVVAGQLKRREPSQEEGMILMRALRDFNTPKMVAPDIPIFLRLVSDLFPKMELPKATDEVLEKSCRQVCAETGLQSDDGFVQKVIELQELVDVRHSVMLIGPAGCSKTSIWKTLTCCHNVGAPKPICVYETINPKAVTSNELYGFMNLAKEWKDGVLSIIMRNMSKNELPYRPAQLHKWVVLDGDIDAVWIESMNTVMDDNKVLTLVSNERIPLSDAMRMLFEIDSLANATPATVSRAGILYINASDVGYFPFVESWVEKRTDQREMATLPGLFHKYMPVLFEEMKKEELVSITPVTPLSMVGMVCHLMESLLDQLASANKGGKADPDDIEALFVFACCWSFGGSLVDSKTDRSRTKFDALWRGQFKKIVIPAEGHVLDYYFDLRKREYVHWKDSVEEYVHVGEDQFSNIYVPTVDSSRISFVMQQLVPRGHPVLLVGGQGTGKTQLMREYLRSMNAEQFYSQSINMNYYTDSLALQKQLEEPIDKRSGRSYGPPSLKKLIYFIDDLNMPFKEEYGTQTPIALLRQYQDYRCWYDRSDPSLKKSIWDVQFVAAMNPTSGSFTINPRLQRHFAVLGMSMPSESDLRLIFTSVVEGHLSVFSESIRKEVGHLVQGVIEMHQTVASKFLPSAVKFHYNFNMRELVNVFQGLVAMSAEFYDKPRQLVRLYYHECSRVFGDRLTTTLETNRFTKMLIDCTKKNFEEHSSEEDLRLPITFTSFVEQTGDGEPAYVECGNPDTLRRYIRGHLRDYNDANPVMNLILFDQALAHVCRICRILRQPRGNALLVGVGGSGKQSLCRLASFICGIAVVTLSVTADYGINDLKEHLKGLYHKAGVRPGIPVVFMLTDSVIVDEKFLVFVNDLLSSGYIPDLFTQEEYDAIFAALRNEAKAAGIAETRDNLMEFFLSRVRANLHIVLCFSPVGDQFRIRARQFPGICNCTTIDWFHPWPKPALVSVASEYLKDLSINGGDEDIQSNVPDHMAEVHLAVTVASEDFLRRSRRHNYTTPKSFLELISFFRHLYVKKRDELERNTARLVSGLDTLASTNRDVELLKEDLVNTMARVEEKKKATEELLQQMGKQRGEAERQGKIAAEKKSSCMILGAEAQKVEEEASAELEAAKPAMEAAADAVNCLSKASLTELKSFSKQPPGVDKVTTAMLILVKGERRNFSWDNAKKMMMKVDQFKNELEEFDATSIPQEVLDRLEPMIQDPNFTFEKMKKKSEAAANLCKWVVSTFTYNKIYTKVKPLMIRVEQAQGERLAAEQSLAEITLIVEDLERRLAELQNSFLEATDEKARVEAEALNCETRLSLAERLVTGLASENLRWGNEVEGLKASKISLIGDVLLSSAFVSYIGAFDARLRDQLWRKSWLEDLISRAIPLTDGVDPLSVLTNDAEIATWSNQGLPSDRISRENAAIVTNCMRWPLLIDPQLQGIKWVAAMETGRCGDFEETNNKYITMQLTHKNWLRDLKHALQNGWVVMVENLGEEVDSVLEPILMRQVIRRGHNEFMRVAGEDISYDRGFRLYLQTKLSNPHYRPEIAAQCTMLNFLVTETGLEDQLLAKVVYQEEPELEAHAAKLRADFNQFKIQLRELENQLLEKLANAPDDILADVELIEGLENTKKTATEIQEAVKKGREMQVTTTKARNQYSPVASEASMLYFMIIQLSGVNHMYQYSLDSFLAFFNKALKSAPPNEDLETRVESLRRELRFTIYKWIARGLFTNDMHILLSMLTFQLLKNGNVGSANDPSGSVG